MADRSVRVRVLLRRWLDAKRGSVSDATWVRYETCGRLHLQPIHDIIASDLTPERVRMLIRDMDGHAATTRMAIIVLRASLDMGIRDGILPRNVTDGLPLPQRPPSPGVALTVDERNRVIAAAAPEFRPLIAVLFGSAPRMGEALALRWSDIGPDTVSISGSIRHQDARLRGAGPRLARQSPKTEAGKRVAPLPDWAKRELDTLPHDAVLVFHRHNGKPLNPSTVQRAFAAAVEAAGLPKMRLHDARHTAITYWIANGASLDDAKRWAGHASISVTSDVYGHLVAGRVTAFVTATREAAG